MSLTVCKNTDHPVIAYDNVTLHGRERNNCPVCEIIKEREAAKDKVINLEQEIEDLHLLREVEYEASIQKGE